MSKAQALGRASSIVTTCSTKPPVRQLELVYLSPHQLKLPKRTARRHSDQQDAMVGANLCIEGMISPLLVTPGLVLIDGALRLKKAIELGMTEIPVVIVHGATEAFRQRAAVYLNKLQEKGSWDPQDLKFELTQIMLNIDTSCSAEFLGITTAELDVIVGGTEAGEEAYGVAGDVGATEPADEPVISRLGDAWVFGANRHRLLCGNARMSEAYATLMHGELAQMGCFDPPYNVPVRGHVSGLGRKTHREFVEASGDLSPAAFTAFLTEFLIAAAATCQDGAILLVAMDWRHMGELLAAGAAAELTLKNLVIWVKTNGGMGSLLRSRHELFFMFKKGDAPHINNVNLGRDGRYRTNVWEYAGQNSFGSSRDADLAAHPSVKPAALVADAIRDVSHHGGIVIDSFCGSGTILIAAEKTGRRARAMELDPLYVDVAIRRFAAFRPEMPITLEATGETFAEVEARRLAAGDFDAEPALTDLDWDIL